MSAIICRKRSFFEDLQSPSPISVSKKLRCSPPSSSLFDQLRALFPDMDTQINNYALKMHLRQAQQSNSLPGFNLMCRMFKERDGA
ncbi:hypothetical protein K7X08_000229 [Anisodus acutangulus]|uniref:Uncharacterized protein n=1 Tax=Anisodus acutangulus TaxID=402998 RepID=A0A9Q1M5I0_9SOLA|nr:hypothetical protein K7X08_000229 [Anisodus acutangulus]